MNLLEKGAIEIVPPAQRESGFYSRYFLVPKKDGGMRPILDLRLLNYALMKRPFRMITLKQMLLQIFPGDWFMSLDLKDLLSHPGSPHHRRFLRFAFEGVAYQVNLFASEDNYHCPIFFTKSTDALAHEWPSLPLFAFPPIAVLRRVREQWHELILIAPIWRNQPWSLELFQLLEAARGRSP